jgi:hypothetical protein
MGGGINLSNYETVVNNTNIITATTTSKPKYAIVQMYSSYHKAWIVLIDVVNNKVIDCAYNSSTPTIQTLEDLSTNITVSDTGISFNMQSWMGETTYGVMFVYT